MNKETEKLILDELLSNLKSQSSKRLRRLKSASFSMKICRLLFFVTVVVLIARADELTQMSGTTLFLASLIGYFACSSMVKLIRNAIDDEKNGHSGLVTWHDSINAEEKN